MIHLLRNLLIPILVIWTFPANGKTSNPVDMSVTSESPIRNNFWTFGLSGTRHTLRAGDGNELTGNTVDVSFGTGILRHMWYSYGTVDILLGPFEPTREKQLDVDYQGTGITYWWGYSAQELDLRHPEGGYGFTMGIKYADIAGRSIGRNRREKGLRSNIENEHQISDYRMRITTFSLIPAIFFCWLKESRATGNSRELLRTRVEGYFLTLGLSLPVLSTYRAQYTSREKGDLGELNVDKNHKETGEMDGFSILINFTSLLGV